MGSIGLLSTCSSSLSSGGGACRAVSQVTLPVRSCPAPRQGDGLCGNGSSMWLLFPGGFPRLFRGPDQKWPQPNLWPRAENSQSGLFNKPSRTNSLHFCMRRRKPQSPTVRAHSSSLRDHPRDPGVPPPLEILKPQAAAGSCASPKLLDHAWVLL